MKRRLPVMAHRDQFFISNLTSAFGGEAEVGPAAQPAASVENDPKATSVGQSTRAPLMLRTAAICFAISAKNGLDTVGGSVQTRATSWPRSK